MNSYTILPKKQLYIILIFCAIIIFSTSIETLIKVKDLDLYENWMQNLNNGSNSQIWYETSFDDYIMANLIYLFFKIAIPMFFSFNSYLAYIRTRINYLFIFIWSTLIIGGILYTFVELSYYSVFYYINIIGYIILFITLLSLINVIDEKNSRKGGEYLGQL